jgi:hypothetical protein
MSPTFVHGRVSRLVALRLAAGVLPSVLAVGLLIGLFYYGKAGRAAPEVFLGLASALTVASIVIAWVNAAYFAERLARLARTTEAASGVTGPTDEFDRIEKAVGTLGTALTASAAERHRVDAAAAARLREQATMLAGAVTDSLSQLDQIRLPLQILLESPFGELNDNQEELLRDARAAADSIDAALRRVGQVADIDRDAFPVQRELVQVNDVVRSVLPLARAAGERMGARTEAAFEPGLPRVLGDRTRLAEALSLLIADVAPAVAQNEPLTIATERAGPRAVVRIAPHRPVAAGEPRSPTLILATRLIEAQGGELRDDDGPLEMRLGEG